MDHGTPEFYSAAATLASALVVIYLVNSRLELQKRKPRDMSNKEWVAYRQRFRKVRNAGDAIALVLGLMATLGSMYSLYYDEAKLAVAGMTVASLALLSIFVFGTFLARRDLGEED